MTSFVRLLALGVTAGLAVGCSNPPTPTAPTPTAPTVSSLAVGLLGQPAVGHPIQLTATAKLSDGTTRDVTTQAAWWLSNSAVATVTADGVLTFMGDGCVRITATYQQVIGYVTWSTTPTDAGCYDY
jgi:hypothetical protein